MTSPTLPAFRCTSHPHSNHVHFPHLTTTPNWNTVPVAVSIENSSSFHHLSILVLPPRFQFVADTSLIHSCLRSLGQLPIIQFDNNVFVSFHGHCVKPTRKLTTNHPPLSFDRAFRPSGCQHDPGDSHGEISDMRAWAKAL